MIGADLLDWIVCTDWQQQQLRAIYHESSLHNGCFITTRVGFVDDCVGLSRGSSYKTTRFAQFATLDFVYMQTNVWNDWTLAGFNSVWGTSETGYLFGRVSEERDELISYSLLNNTAEGYHLRLIWHEANKFSINGATLFCGLKLVTEMNLNTVVLRNDYPYHYISPNKHLNTLFQLMYLLSSFNYSSLLTFVPHR